MFERKTTKVCVIGSLSFNTGIGKHTVALCELLSRYVSVSLIPLQSYKKDSIKLPTGRVIPICQNPKEIEVSFYCGILWNYVGDKNILKMPQQGLHYALMAFDSDVVPNVWVDILNTRFDGVYCVNRHLESFVKSSGVTIPVGTLPLALDLHKHLLQTYQISDVKEIVIGGVTSFHQRKQNDLLIKAFGTLQSKYKNIKLKIHSNLNFGNSLDCCNKLKQAQLRPDDIELSVSDLDNHQLFQYLNSIDIFVNCSRGEGFSIGPREAAALGKVIVLSDVYPHRDFIDVPGIFMVTGKVPMISQYPELDGIVAGTQYSVTEGDLTQALDSAIQYFLKQDNESDALDRKLFASQWDFDNVSKFYLGVVNPDSFDFYYPEEKTTDSIGNIPIEIQEQMRKHFGRFSESLVFGKKNVLLAHDGGFFSLFNAYMTNLVWSEGDPRVSVVLPDWRVDNFLKRQGDKKVVSFCYGQPEEGNIFTSLFKPLPGLSDKDFLDQKLLRGSAKLIPEGDEYFNVKREPLLTYINASKLYASEDFQHFRIRYNRFLEKYIHLQDYLQIKIDKFSSQFKGKFVIGAHVRHPSHAIEQAERTMPTPRDYIQKIKEILEEEKPKDWVIFLATDQERTIDIFEKEFSNKVVYYKNVRRLSDFEDKDFDALKDKATEGFQLQHKVAKNIQNWSLHMAEEVICDAWTMAKCNVLLHVTSNVSTAVSYIGPETRFITVKPGKKDYGAD